MTALRRRMTEDMRVRNQCHLIAGLHGAPLALAVTGANQLDLVIFDVLIHAIPALPGLSGLVFSGRRRRGLFRLDAGGFDYLCPFRGFTARERRQLFRRRWGGLASRLAEVFGSRRAR